MAYNYSDKELSNIAQLKALREARGLTVKNLAIKTGVNESNIRAYEYGNGNPKPETYNKLALFFGWDTVIIKSKAKSLYDLPDFAVGHVYFIKCKKASKNSTEKDFDKTGFDVDFCFRYDGKHGDLLHFTEIHGGWTRTYAEYQLIGKKIMEVK